jgi:hypothetical protein
MSKKIFEQHVDFFRVHVLAHVVDPHNRDVGVPTHMHSARPCAAAAASTHATQSSTLLTLFHTSLRMDKILSAAGLLSQHTMPSDANSWLRGTISSVV